MSLGGKTNVPDDTIWPLVNAFPCSANFCTNHWRDLKGLPKTSDDTPSFNFSPSLNKTAWTLAASSTFSNTLSASCSSPYTTRPPTAQSAITLYFPKSGNQSTKRASGNSKAPATVTLWNKSSNVSLGCKSSFARKVNSTSNNGSFNICKSTSAGDCRNRSATCCPYNGESASNMSWVSLLVNETL